MLSSLLITSILLICILLSIKIRPCIYSSLSFKNKNIIDNNTFKLYSNKWKTINPSFIKIGNDYIYSIRLIYEDYDNSGNESFLILGKKDGNEIVWNNPIKTAKKNSYFNNFRGIEDIRLFTFNNKIYFLGTSLQEIGVEGLPQMVLGNLSLEENNIKNVIHLKSPMNPPSCEKNWLPLNINEKELTFIYRWEYENINNKNIWKLNPILGVSDLNTGNTIIINKTKTLDKIPYFRGSTIPVFTKHNRPKSIVADSNAMVSIQSKKDRWVCLIHEFTPTEKSRIYYQRWVEFEQSDNKLDLNVTFVSKPFTLTSTKGIEFPMSMYPEQNYDNVDWIICFGKDDSSAYLNHKLI